MSWIVKLAKQPSTYRGLSLLLGAVGVSISPELADKIGLLVIAALGVIETFRDERKPLTAAKVEEIVNDREPVEPAQRIGSPTQNAYDPNSP